jgi:calcium-binding protein CML
MKLKIQKFLKDQVKGRLSEIEKEQLFRSLTEFSNEGNPFIQRVSLLHMAHTINERHTVEILKLFQEIDANHNGKISAQELHGFFKSSGFLGEQINTQIVNQFLKSLDQNKNEMIDYREFLAANIRKMLFQSVNKEEENFQNMVKAFKFFDFNEDGYICSEDLVVVLGKFNLEVDHVMAEYLIEEADVNNDERISFEEFLQVMKKRFDEESNLSEIFSQTASVSLAPTSHSSLLKP